MTDAPIELFEFKVSGAGLATYTYTSSEQDYVGSTEPGGTEYTWSAIPIGRSSIQTNGSVVRDNIKISFAIDNPLIQEFLKVTPDYLILLTVYTVRPSGTFVAYKGRLAALSADVDRIDMTFESLYTTLKQTGLRENYQRSCRFMLYDKETGRGCQVDKPFYRQVLTVSAMDNFTMTVDTPVPDPKYFEGGMVQHDNYIDATVQARGILEVADTKYKLTSRWPWLVQALLASPTGTVDLSFYPGCDRSLGMCKTRFDNAKNFGGFPYIPTKNPFSGNKLG